MTWTHSDFNRFSSTRSVQEDLSPCCFVFHFGLHVFSPMITFNWLLNQLSSVCFHTRVKRLLCSKHKSLCCSPASGALTHNAHYALAFFMLCLCIPAPLLDTFLEDSNDCLLLLCTPHWGQPLSPDIQATFLASVFFFICSIIYTLMIIL